MDPQALLHTIKANYPDLQWEQYELIDTGWDNFIIILDEKIVFRFPKKERSKSVHAKEGPILDMLSKRITLPIPHYEFFGADNAFVGYYILPGDQMSAEHYHEHVSENAQHTIQKQLAQFFAELHAIPVDIFRALGYGLRQSHWTKVKDIFTTLCGKFFSIQELVSIMNYIGEAESFVYREEVFVHGDMTGRNILINYDNSKLAGIIDFSDAKMGDPALDFDCLWWYGEEFISNVIALYPSDDKKGIFNRSFFYWKRRFIWELIYAVQKSQKVEEKLENMKRRFFLPHSI